MQRRRGTSSGQPRQGRWFVFALFSLVVFWSVCFLVLASKWHSGFLHTIENGLEGEVPGPPPQKNEAPSDVSAGKNVEEIPLEPRNLSRTGKVISTADVRGNLGPASVVVQPRPGKDWIHDRWQAASDMHGTAIGGAHWIHLDFGTEIVPERIVLDWEAAYSDKYRLEGSLEPIDDHTAKDKIWTVFDSTDPTQKERIAIEKVGQSPGVKTKTPLHVIHTLHPLQNTKPLRYMRLYILSSAMGWGVSLWQFDVIGFSKEEVIE
jgi:hypothetical protein